MYDALAATEITVVSIGHRESLGIWHTQVVDVVPVSRPAGVEQSMSTTVQGVINY